MTRISDARELLPAAQYLALIDAARGAIDSRFASDTWNFLFVCGILPPHWIPVSLATVVIGRIK